MMSLGHNELIRVNAYKILICWLVTTFGPGREKLCSDTKCNCMVCDSLADSLTHCELWMNPRRAAQPQQDTHLKSRSSPKSLYI